MSRAESMALDDAISPAFVARVSSAIAASKVDVSELTEAQLKARLAKDRMIKAFEASRAKPSIERIAWYVAQHSSVKGRDATDEELTAAVIETLQKPDAKERR